MDIDSIRDQKLGSGAGMRSSKVCVFVYKIHLRKHRPQTRYIIPEPAHV